MTDLIGRAVFVKSNPAASNYQLSVKPYCVSVPCKILIFDLMLIIDNLKFL